jgi:GMP synthase-like glutamine amidotransferase
MRVHYLQHVPFEAPAAIATLLEASGHELSGARLFEPGGLPALGAFDGLVAMGGPMSANDEGEYPWLAGEKALIREAIAAGKPVLGVCLGAQLIASALGARVYPNAEKEIGWFPLEGLPSEDPAIFRFPASMRAFHWHGETFDLPRGAIRLARSAACENQAFQLGASVVGLQFHLETSPESARALVDHCGEELRPARFVQSADEILSAGAGDYAAMGEVLGPLLAFLFGR